MNQDTEDDPRQKQKDTPAEDVPIIADRLDRAPAKYVSEDQSADNPQQHKWADKWMVRLTAGLVLLAAVSAVVGYLQWTSINGQLEEMRSSGSQTERQIILAMGQLAVANRAATSASIQADAATQTTKNFRVEQRAWMGVKTMDLKGIVFSNFGRFPATHISNAVNIHIDEKHIKITDAWVSRFYVSNPEAILNYGPLFPGEPMEAPWPAQYPPNKSTHWGEVSGGVRFLYIFGEVHYFTLGEWHTTKFCGEWIPTFNRFDPGNDCKAYNDAN
jgi:hypothetical protein